MSEPALYLPRLTLKRARELAFQSQVDIDISNLDFADRSTKDIEALNLGQVGSSSPEPELRMMEAPDNPSSLPSIVTPGPRPAADPTPQRLTRPGYGPQQSETPDSGTTSTRLSRMGEGSGASAGQYSPANFDPESANPEVMRWAPLVQEAAQQYGVPEADLYGLMDLESGGNPAALSPQGAMSLMQVMPFHFGEGEDGMDPRTNIFRGAKIYADNLRRYGSREKAAAAYFGAIDDAGNITGATDATGTDGYNYVRIFDSASRKYGSGSVTAAPQSPQPTQAAPTPQQPGESYADWLTRQGQQTPQQVAPPPSQQVAPPRQPQQQAAPTPPAQGGEMLTVRPIDAPDRSPRQISRRDYDLMPPGWRANHEIIASDMQRVGTAPDPSGMSAGDQKRARLAAAQGESPDLMMRQPLAEQPTDDPGGYGSLPPVDPDTGRPGLMPAPEPVAPAPVAPEPVAPPPVSAPAAGLPQLTHQAADPARWERAERETPTTAEATAQADRDTMTQTVQSPRGLHLYVPNQINRELEEEVKSIRGEAGWSLTEARSPEEADQIRRDAQRRIAEAEERAHAKQTRFLEEERQRTEEAAYSATVEGNQGILGQVWQSPPVDALRRGADDLASRTPSIYRADEASRAEDPYGSGLYRGLRTAGRLASDIAGRVDPFAADQAALAEDPYGSGVSRGLRTAGQLAQQAFPATPGYNAGSLTQDVDEYSRSVSPAQRLARIVQGQSAIARQYGGPEEDAEIRALIEAHAKAVAAGNTELAARLWQERVARAERANRIASQDHYEAGRHSPDKTLETMTDLATAGITLPLAPSMGSGVARNIAAAALDPIGQGIGIAAELPERAGAIGRAVRGVRGAGRLPTPRSLPVGGLEDDTVLAGQMPGFYSQLRRTIEEKVPNRASAEQIRAAIRNNQVKAEEIAWTGLEEWLAAQTGPVTKQQVLDYLDATSVQVVEVGKGSASEVNANPAPFTATVGDFTNPDPATMVHPQVKGVYIVGANRGNKRGYLVLDAPLNVNAAVNDENVPLYPDRESAVAAFVERVNARNAGNTVPVTFAADKTKFRRMPDGSMRYPGIDDLSIVEHRTPGEATIYTVDIGDDLELPAMHRNLDDAIDDFSNIVNTRRSAYPAIFAPEAQPDGFVTHREAFIRTRQGDLRYPGVDNLRIGIDEPLDEGGPPVYAVYDAVIEDLPEFYGSLDEAIAAFQQRVRNERANARNAHNGQRLRVDPAQFVQGEYGELRYPGIDDMYIEAEHDGRRNVYAVARDDDVNPPRFVYTRNQAIAEFERQVNLRQQGQTAYINDDGNRVVVQGVPTRHGTYTVPGGQDPERQYGELLLTVPTPVRGLHRRVPGAEAEKAYLDYIQQMEAKYGGQGEWPSRATPEEMAEARRLQAEAQNYWRDKDNPDFRVSGHWREPNVVAHVRFTTRTTPDGKKTLHIEELQSDWHQQGRERGYQPGPGRRDEIRRVQERIGDIKVRETQLVRKGDLTDKEAAELERIRVERDNLLLHTPDGIAQRRKQLFDEAYQAHERGDNAASRRLMQEYKALGRRETAIEQPGVPDAPFKGQAWSELAIKRMIRWAAEKGYDRLSWTPGLVHSERWNLGQVVDRLEWSRQPNGVVTLTGFKGGRQVVNKNMTAEKLTEQVGAKMANDILDSPETSGHYEGEGLGIGTRGMAGFYDESLVNTANKLGRKFGARVRRGRINLPTVNTSQNMDRRALSIDFNPDAQPGRRWVVSVLPRFLPRVEVDITDEVGRLSRSFGTREEALRWVQSGGDGLIDQINAKTTNRPGLEAWEMDITPRMRESVMTEGQPLFADRPGSAPNSSMATPTSARGLAERYAVPRNTNVGGALGSAVGAIAGGTAGYESQDENASWDRKLAMTLIGAAGGAGTGILAGRPAAKFGTVGAAMVIDSLIKSGRLSPDIIRLHPDPAKRIATILGMAAEGLEDGDVVEAPGLAQWLANTNPQKAEKFLTALRSGMTAGEVRRLVAEELGDGESFWRNVSEVVSDAITGFDTRGYRGKETRADVVGTRGELPPDQRNLVDPRPDRFGSTLKTPYGNAYESEDPDLVGLVRNMAQQLGIQDIRVYTVDSSVSNALVIQNPAAKPALVLTRGLITSGASESMVRGLIAHELGHVAEDIQQAAMKAGTSPTGAVSAAMASSGTGPVFYSQLRRTVEEKVPNRANAQQILATIKAGGVKADELAWTEIEDWLKMQKGPIRKQDLLDYLEKTEVRLEEVDRGGPGQLEALWGQTGYRVAGNPETDKYGEKLLTVPVPARGRNARPELQKELEELRQLGEKYGVKIPGDYGDEGFDAAVDRLIETARGADQQRIADLYLNRFPRDAVRYRHTHWEDTPNVAVHVRHSDRTTPDGKRVLVLEEVQSDWHQKGRDFGYQDGPGVRASMRRREERLAEIDRLLEDPSLDPTAADKLMEESARLFEETPAGLRTLIDALEMQLAEVPKRSPEGIKLRRGIEKARRKLQSIEHPLVPDVPFAGGGWSDLALKRMIRYAAENGYDRIAWSPGMIHSERYNLGARVDRLEWSRANDGHYYLDGYRGTSRVASRHVQDWELEDFVGKDLADRIIADQARKGVISDDTGQIALGTKGMEGFYDQVMPAAANKLGRKFGARVKRGHITPPDSAPWKIEADETGVTVVDAHQRQEIEWFDSIEDAQRWIDNRMRPENFETWELDITPRMRESVVRDGQPLYVVPPGDEPDIPVRLPEDPAFASAVERIGGRVDPNAGVDIQYTRAQSPEGAGKTAIRDAVFGQPVSPGGRSTFVTAADEPAEVGGTQVIPPVPTRFRAPIVTRQSVGPADEGGFDDLLERLGADPHADVRRQIREVEGRRLAIDRQALLAARDVRKASEDLRNARHEVFPDLSAVDPITDEMLEGLRADKDGEDWYRFYVEVKSRYNEATARRAELDAQSREVWEELRRLQEESGFDGLTTFHQVNSEIRKAKEAGPRRSPARAAALRALLEKYGGNPDHVDELMAVRGDSDEGYWTIRENILAANARRKGYDSIFSMTVQEDNAARSKLIQEHPEVVAANEKMHSAQLKSELSRESLPRLRNELGDGTDEFVAAQIEDERLRDAYNEARTAYYAAIDKVSRETPIVETGWLSEVMDLRLSHNPTPGTPNRAIADARVKVAEAEAEAQSAAEELFHLEGEFDLTYPGWNYSGPGAQLLPPEAKAELNRLYAEEQRTRSLLNEANIDLHEALYPGTRRKNELTEQRDDIGAEMRAAYQEERQLATDRSPEAVFRRQEVRDELDRLAKKYADLDKAINEIKITPASEYEGPPGYQLRGDMPPPRQYGPPVPEDPASMPGDTVLGGREIDPDEWTQNDIRIPRAGHASDMSPGAERLLRATTGPDVPTERLRRADVAKKAEKILGMDPAQIQAWQDEALTEAEDTRAVRGEALRQAEYASAEAANSALDRLREAQQRARSTPDPSRMSEDDRFDTADAALEAAQAFQALRRAGQASTAEGRATARALSQRRSVIVAKRAFEVANRANELSKDAKDASGALLRASRSGQLDDDGRALLQILRDKLADPGKHGVGDERGMAFLDTLEDRVSEMQVGVSQGLMADDPGKIPPPTKPLTPKQQARADAAATRKAQREAEAEARRVERAKEAAARVEAAEKRRVQREQRRADLEAEAGRIRETVAKIDYVLKHPEAEGQVERFTELQRELAGISDLGKKRSSTIRARLHKNGLLRAGLATKGDDVDPIVQALARTDPNDPKTMLALMNIISKPRLIDKILEYQYVNLLSSPMTQAINITSNAMQIAGRLFMQNPLEFVYGGGGGARDAFGGFARGLKEAMPEVREIMRTGTSQGAINRATEIGDYGHVNREALTEQFGRLGAAAHMISTRPLQAMDVLLGHAVYASTVDQLARRKVDSLMKAGDEAVKGMTKAQAKRYILSNIWDHTDLIDQAGKIQDYTLLKSNDSGTAGWGRVERWLRTGARLRQPGADAGTGDQIVAFLFNQVLPFFNVPLNFAKQGVERTAGVPYNLVKGLTAKTPEERAERLAKATIGAAGLTMAAVLASGDNLTGEGPEAQGERAIWELDHKRNSFRVPGTKTWFSWEGTPFAIPFGVVAGVKEGWSASTKRSAKKGVTDPVDAFASAGLKGLQGGASAFASQSFARAFFDQYALMTGQRTGLGTVASSAAGTVSRNIPLSSFWNFLATVGDQFERDAYRPETPRELPENVGARLAARLPGLRGRIDTRLTPYGEDMPNERFGLAGAVPYFRGRGAMEGDAITGAIQRAGIGAIETPDDVSYPGIDHSQYGLEGPKERRVYAQATGQAWRRVLESNRNAVVNGLPDEAHDKLRSAARETGQLAVAGAIGPVEVRRRIEARRKARAQQQR